MENPGVICANHVILNYFNDLLEKRGNIVYGDMARDDRIHHWGLKGLATTHKAILINIEELVKCEHEAQWWQDGPHIRYENYCHKCLIKLKPTWVEA